MVNTGERIGIYPPSFQHLKGDVVLASIPLEGDHPEVKFVPNHIGSLAYTETIGSTILYKCPFTGEPRTLWMIRGHKGEVTKLVQTFARDNNPTEAARKVIFGNR